MNEVISETTSNLTQFKDLIDQSRNIVIIVKDQPSLDQLATASTLAQLFSENGKEVLFLSPSVPAETYELFGVNSLTTKMGNQNLVVSFDYSETAVDKVSYHIGEESGKFFLTIKPKKGHPPLDSSSVEFEYAGVEADLIILVGVHDLETLDTLYYGNESFFENTPIVTMHNFETDLGMVKFDFSNDLCLAEGLVEILDYLQLNLIAETATNLLYSIEEKTANMTNALATAKSFEVVARLLRVGARRRKLASDAVGAKNFSAKEEKQSQSNTNDVFEVGKNKSKNKIAGKKITPAQRGGLDHKPVAYN